MGWVLTGVRGGRGKSRGFEGKLEEETLRKGKYANVIGVILYRDVNCYLSKGMLRRLLSILLSSAFWGFTITDSQIKNIVSPKLDFSTNQLGSISMTFHFQAFFIPSNIMPDIKAKIIFPFVVSNPLSVEWLQINDACIISSNMNYVTSTVSTIVADASMAHYFDMIGANYYPGSKYKLVVRIQNVADIPSTLGYTDPIKFQIVSSSTANPVVFAYNNQFGYIGVTPAAPPNFELDLSPSFDDPNIREITRDFTGKADIRIVDTNVSRILIKVDNYVFSDDAESTCATEPNQDRGIEMLDRTTFYCEFEDARKKGLYFIWKDTVFPPLDKTFRLRFRLKNPDNPAKTSLSVSMYDRYAPTVLKYRNMVDAFECKATSFGTLYPRLFIGPNLDVSSDYFPNVTLFTKGNKYDSITYNSLRLEFKTSLDLPKPSTYYQVHIRLGAGIQTTIPISLIYHDLPLALGQTYVIPRLVTTPAITPTVWPNPNPASPPAATVEEIVFDNVAELSSRTLYTIGFKIGFQSGSGTNLIFLGDTSFCSMYVTDSTGTVVYVNKKAPPNLKSSFKVQPITNVILQTLTPASMPLITHVHTIENNDLSTVGNTSPLSYQSTPNGFAQSGTAKPVRYGLRLGAEKWMFLAYNAFTSVANVPTGVITTKQTFLEIITSQYITAVPNTGTTYIDTPAQAQLNCFLYTASTGNPTATPAEINSCNYEFRNKGLFGSEYSVFRMGGVTPANYWAQGIYGWRRVNISKVHSIVKDSTDSAIIDFYINAYGDAFTSNIKDYFPRGLKYQGLINGFVFTTSQFANTNLNYINFMRGSTVTNMLDPDRLPGFLRVGGLLDGINTFKTKKLVLFFREVIPLFLELDGNIEVGCSTSAKADVKCYFYKGEDNALCDGGTVCYNYLSENRLEILMSSTISSIADVFKVQILVPIAFPVNTGTHRSSYGCVVGTASQYEGSLSYFPDMMSHAPFNHAPISSGAPGPFTNKIIGCTSGCTSMTGVNIVGGGGTVKSVYQPITSPPMVGSSVTTKFDVNCQGTTYAQCSPVTSGVDFWSITFCTEYDFMLDTAFGVTSSTGGGTNIYEQCVFRLKYKWKNTANVIKYKYCMYCPQWSNGLSTGLVNINNFRTPSKYGMKVAPNSWGAISGRVSNSISGTNYGIFSITDQSQLTGSGYTPNYVRGFTVLQSLAYTSTPATSGMNLILNFTGVLSNPVPTGGYLVFVATNLNFPFDFISGTTSSFCKLIEYNVDCQVQGYTATTFYIQSPVEIAASVLTIVFTGVRSKLNSAALPTSTNIELRTYTAAGMTVNDRIDLCQTPAVLNLVEYMENSVVKPMNILLVDNLRLAEAVSNYRTELMFDVTLGSSKTFHNTDSLVIDLMAGSYFPMDPANTYPVMCEILDPTTLKVLPEFTLCDVNNLNNIVIETKTITPYSKFTVRILNYVVMATNGGTQMTAKIVFKPTPATIIQQYDPAYLGPDWVGITTAAVIPSVSINKKISFFGLRPDFTFSVTPSVSTITYESRVYIQFPSQYNSGFGSFPIGCYQETATDPIKLYCWKLRDRTLAITGFRVDVPTGTQVSITVYGIQQPVHPATELEKFFISIDSDDNPTALTEMKAVTIPGTPSQLAGTVPLLSIRSSEYSHKFIRAINTFLFKMLTPTGLNILPGWIMYVYIDYLEFEYDIAPFTGTCTIKLNQMGANLAAGCVRQGNRYKITIGATALLPSTEYTVLIENIPTPDFYACRVKRPEIYILDTALVLKTLSTDTFQNTDVMTFVGDEKYTYFTFKGMTPDAPLQFKKGVYNPIMIQRIDELRFNDDFTFKLGFTENNIFSENDPAKVSVYHSHFGLSQLPIYLASTLNTFTNVIPITVNFTARFRNSIFAKLPLLRAQLVNTKSTLIVPSSITVWTSKGSLPFYIKINELPLVDLTFNLAFTGTTSLTVSPSTITLGTATRLIKVQITSSHPAGPSAETAVLQINPPATASGYGITQIPIVLQEYIAGVATQPSILLSESRQYGFSIDYAGPKPVAFYSITMPSSIFRTFTKAYIVDKWEKNNRSDDKYYVDYTLCEGTDTPNVVVNEVDLRSKETYKTIFYGVDLDGAVFTTSLTFVTQDTAGGFGYVNLTFASPVADSTKSDLVCHMAQLFSYPLEK